MCMTAHGAALHRLLTRAGRRAHATASTSPSPAAAIPTAPTAPASAPRTTASLTTRRFVRASVCARVHVLPDASDVPTPRLTWPLCTQRRASAAAPTTPCLALPFPREAAPRVTAWPWPTNAAAPSTQVAVLASLLRAPCPCTGRQLTGFPSSPYCVLRVIIYPCRKPPAAFMSTRATVKRQTTASTTTTFPSAGLQTS